MSLWPGMMLAAAMGVATLFATLGLRTLLIRRAVLDIPNERSSHAVPVPRAGGAGFVALIVIMLAVAAMADSGIDDAMRVSAGLAAVAMLCVAAIGLVDDVRGVAPALRLVVHLACGLAAVASQMHVISQSLALGWIAALALTAAAAIFAAWCVNMVNFMDGIDGIAAAEGAFVLACTGAMLIAAEPSDDLGWLLIAAAMALIGFLVVNMSSARIFMGDCGSGALGLLVAWALLAAVSRGTLDPWAAAALPAAFMADAGTALVLRVAAGANPAQAHRTHAYQRAVRRGASHRAVTGTYSALNFALVAPIAVAAQCWPNAGPWLVTGLYAAFVVAAFLAGAGREPATGTTPRKLPGTAS